MYCFVSCDVKTRICGSSGHSDLNILSSLVICNAVLSLLSYWTSWKQFFFPSNNISSKFCILSTDKISLHWSLDILQIWLPISWSCLVKFLHIFICKRDIHEELGLRGSELAYLYTTHICDINSDFQIKLYLLSYITVSNYC